MPEDLDFYHVSSALNRDSIARHGLDWTRMAAAPGIAGSARPEVDGVFVCRGMSEVTFFQRINNTGGPVDVWSVDGVDEALLSDNGSGFVYLPARIPPGRLRLLPPGPEAQQAREAPAQPRKRRKR